MMKKRLIILGLMFIFIISVCGFSSCHGPQYEEEDKENLAETGWVMMQDWLDENIRGSEVLSSEGCVDIIPSGPEYLTSFVEGTFSDGEETRDYLIDTASGAVYLLYDGEWFKEACEKLVLEILNLNGVSEDCRVSGFSAELMIPAGDGLYNGSEDLKDPVWLPGELVLSVDKAGDNEDLKILDGFIRDTGRKEEIEVRGTILVPEKLSLESYDMEYWLKQRTDRGIYFNSFHLEDSLEEIATFSGQTTYYSYRFREVKDPDIRIRMRDKYRVEKKEKDGVKVLEAKESDFSDLTFEKTAEGYLITFPDREHIFDFSIYADPGSRFLETEYHSHEDREAYLSPGSKISGDRYFEKDLYWKETDGNGFVLSNEDGTIKFFFGGEELIPRGRCAIGTGKGKGVLWTGS